MTRKEKQLLLQDICARLPYGVKVKCPFDDEPYTLLSINWNKEIVVIGFMMDEMFVTSKEKLVNIKPYLRPMSSMTEEEKMKLSLSVSPQGSAIYYDKYIGIPLTHLAQQIPYEYLSRVLDWLNAHHFDYWGLIEKGLALSTEEFNPYKD